MAARTSIELHPDGGRLVEVQIAPRGREASASDARVRLFTGDLPAPTELSPLTARLTALRTEHKLAKDVWVVLWGLRAAHQFLRLPPARPGDLEAIATREARKDIAALEGGGDRASVGILVGGEVQVGAQRRREVSLVAVSGAEVRRRIGPIVDAGFVVAGVLTPALALTAVARAQRDIAAGTAAVYVAITRQATCLAIVRDGVLLFAREMAWGHASDGAPLDALATRLASEVRRSVLFFKQTFRAPVEHVVLCGDMANLRALTGPLGTALTVSVQTLDSLVGIDATAPPAPAERFRAEVAAYRMAIATGAEADPPINLLPAAIRVTREARTQLVRLAASVAAAVVLIGGWSMLERRGVAVQRAELATLEQQIAALGPEAERIAALKETRMRATAQAAALTAFDSQGPRLARTLEALAEATPDGIVFTSVTVEALGAQWQLTVSGVAIAEDAAAGQAALNELVRVVSQSPFVGAPTDTPSLRVVAGKVATASADRDVPIPEWGSGVEFGLKFLVAK